MTEKAFQDYYPEYFAHCYGCGSMNELGHQIKSFWDGEESVCHFQPKPYHTAIPGYVYGGLLASLVDCHGTGTAAAAGYRAENRAMDTEPPLRYLTASLHVDYLKPTPLGPVLEDPREGEGSKGSQSCDRRMDRGKWGDYRERGVGCGAGAREFGEGIAGKEVRGKK